MQQSFWGGILGTELKEFHTTLRGNILLCSRKIAEANCTYASNVKSTPSLRALSRIFSSSSTSVCFEAKAACTVFSTELKWEAVDHTRISLHHLSKSVPESLRCAEKAGCSSATCFMTVLVVSALLCLCAEAPAARMSDNSF